MRASGAGLGRMRPPVGALARDLRGLPRGKPFIACTRGRAVITDEEDFAICVECGNPLENCQCVCAFCGERDECECALGDSATGG